MIVRTFQDFHRPRKSGRRTGKYSVGICMLQNYSPLWMYEKNQFDALLLVDPEGMKKGQFAKERIFYGSLDDFWTMG